MSRDFTDCIHGNLNLPEDCFKIIKIGLFQRLTFVKQLATTNQVFINANHSRKEHSLGVAHLAARYAQRLFPNDSGRGIRLTVAALLHDIGHGPFSHSWDKIIYSQIYAVEKGHDEHRKYILREVFKDVLDFEVEDIIAIWEKKDLILSALLQGPLGVDRMDFINRDTQMTSTSHFGTLDIQRIINNTFIIGDKLCYSAKILPDIIQGYGSRLAMYQNVYLHKTSVASIILIELMIKLANNKCKFVNQTQNLTQFKRLTDECILAQVLQLTPTDRDTRLAQYLAECYYDRKLPKLHSENKISTLQPPDTYIVDQTPNYIDIRWISTPINLDIANEFDKFKIHIFDPATQTLQPFSTYLNSVEPALYWCNLDIIKYQIQRTYRLFVPTWPTE